MKLNHPVLIDSLRRAYSAEKAAALAYIGHAASLRDPAERAAVRRIEADEWDHRRHVGAIMRTYGITASRWYEFKYHVIGRLIGASCHVIGRFMPYFFAGKLESGNVCEYFVMIHRFHALGITAHDPILHEMGVREKEHEVHFLAVLRDARWLPLFERVFAWGLRHSANDVTLEPLTPVAEADQVCRRFSRGRGSDADTARR